MMIRTGLDKILAENSVLDGDLRFGYLSNQASCDQRLVHGRISLKEKFGGKLTCLLSPQHGFYSDRQDNMIESDHTVDEVTGLPVFSLYGETRRPTASMYDQLDCLVIDLQDVGTRVYTYASTMAYCMEVAAELGKRVVVLDRPNPIGGNRIEGNLLETKFQSFVGLFPIPMRHGLTFGELAKLFNETFGIGCDLEIIPMDGWERWMGFRDTGLPWIAPSPNMPSPETALVYPGQVIWEGTQDSEGRGTTQPFEFVGGPYWNHKEIIERIGQTELPGCVLRPIKFEPTSGKWKQRLCTGFQVHVTNPEIFRPYRTSLTLLQAVMHCHPDLFRYKEPPYEYEYDTLPMDVILGSQDVRLVLEDGADILEMERGWEEELEAFEETRRQVFIYWK